MTSITRLISLTMRGFLCLVLFVFFVADRVSAAAPPPPPPAPANLEAIPDYGTNSIEVAWDNVAGETGFRVYRRTGPGGQRILLRPLAAVSHRPGVVSERRRKAGGWRRLLLWKGLVVTA